MIQPARCSWPIPENPDVWLASLASNPGRLGGCGCCLGLAQAQNCQSLLDQFNHAIDAGQEAGAQSLVDQIATNAECGRLQVSAQRRLAALRLSAVQLLMARGRPVSASTAC